MEVERGNTQQKRNRKEGESEEAGEKERKGERERGVSMNGNLTLSEFTTGILIGVEWYQLQGDENRSK